MINRQVKGALIDSYVASARKDLFLNSDFIAKQIIRYPTAYGFVLSGSLTGIQNQFRDYVSSNQQEILALISANTKEMEVCTHSLPVQEFILRYNKPLFLEILDLWTILCSINLVKLLSVSHEVQC